MGEAINKHNASYYGKLGGIARAQAYRLAKAALLNPPMSQALPEAGLDESFRNKVALRVRKQIDEVQQKMDDQLAKDTLDSKVLKELTDALFRLETIEQKLSGRASPGSLRPSSGKRQDRKTYSPPTPVAEPETPPDTTRADPQNG